MPQAETLPQSMVDIKTIVLKPRLDQGDIQLIGEKVKPRLFAKFGLKPKPDDIRLLASETYFEPYLIIGGKYALDYCKKHVFEVNVSEKTTKVFVAGHEFKSEQTDPKAKNRVIKMTGEEYAHHERQTYFILDRMKREISPEKLPISPFDIQKENSNLNSNFKSINIPDETQIEFLKTKIAKKPDHVAEIIKEVFDITERTIAYYPMYQLTFENTKNQKDATITINGITGEIILSGTKKLDVKTIVTFPISTSTQPIETAAYQTAQTQTVVNISPAEGATDTIKNVSEEDESSLQTISEAEEATDTIKNVSEEDESSLQTISEAEEATDTIKNVSEEDESSLQTISEAEETTALGFPAKISGDVFTVGDDVTAVVGDMEVPSGTTINKNIAVKGALRIGDNCRIHGKLEVLKDITVGADTVIDGDLISGGNVFVGPRSLITGSVKAAGVFEIEENAVVEGVCTQTPPPQ